MSSRPRNADDNDEGGGGALASMRWMGKGADMWVPRVICRNGPKEAIILAANAPTRVLLPPACSYKTYWRSPGTASGIQGVGGARWGGGEHRPMPRMPRGTSFPALQRWQTPPGQANPAGRVRNRSCPFHCMQRTSSRLSWRIRRITPQSR